MINPGPMQQLLDTLPQRGQVEWIGIRPARGAKMIELTEVEASQGIGLLGDRFKGSDNSPRQVTLIQQEHLAVIAACAGLPNVEAALLRRNIVVSGINLLALKEKSFRIGDALLEFSGACHPCSKMETALGAGGYNAMRGHGGITARVVEGGRIAVDDPLFYPA
jgi:MOSC domain-containing protein YiiM